MDILLYYILYKRILFLVVIMHLYTLQTDLF